MKTRKELYERAKKTYEALLNRTADRYYNDKQYVVSDKVGYECTRIEDVLRPMWGIAPFLKNGDLNVEVNGEKISAVDFINGVVLDGTDENSPRRFDRNVTEETKYSFANQSVTELAAYLVAVYFAKETLWDVLDKEKQDKIASFIKKWSVAAITRSWQNNHYWYPIYCIEILKQLGYDCGEEADREVEKGYEFLETLYYGNGWYSDGELGRFDYYEAWAHHTYTLLWILIADKNRPDYKVKCEKYRKRSEEYLRYFIHYFDSDGGMAAYGRSIGYRFAAVAPFGLAALTGCDIDLGIAKSVILKNIDYFYQNSIPTDDGCFPVGYLYESSGFGESYASDGAISCYTEGLLCLIADEDHPLWQAEMKKLPIESGSYLLRCPLSELQTAIAGNNEKNGVTLYNNGLHYYQNEFFGHRFNDMAGAYSKFAYNSRSGFALSAVDQISSDNMISLYTPDGTMVSHRRRILDPEMKGGVMKSRHLPFSNDPETEITTYMLPLDDGFHVRVHKIKLSRPYKVCEGGFSIGVRDDGYKMCGNKALYGNAVSTITTVTEAPFSYRIAASQPGMHLLSPQAIYPSYMTETLDRGEYVFLTTVYFSTDGNEETHPEIEFDGKTVTVKQNGNAKTFEI